MSKRALQYFLPDDGISKITEYSLNLLFTTDDEMNSSEVTCTAGYILLLTILAEEGESISTIKNKKCSTAGPMIDPLIKS